MVDQSTIATEDVRYTKWVTPEEDDTLVEIFVYSSSSYWYNDAFIINKLYRAACSACTH